MVTPIVINTISDLQAIKNNPSGYYILGADIDASAVNWTTIEEFAGVLDGNGHSISNLNSGLFNVIDAVGIVENLNLVDVAVVSISGSEAALALENDGVVLASSVTGGIGGSSLTGALVEVNNGSISQCYSQATVQSINGGAIGGLVGYNGRTGAISNSYATGSVYAAVNAAGLVGENDGFVTSSYATGVVTTSDAVRFPPSGLVGQLSQGTAIDSYWDIETSATSYSAGGGIGLTTAQFESGTLPAGFDPTVWFDTAGQFPQLQRQAPSNHLPTVSASVQSTCSEDDSSYPINLLQFASDLDNDVLHVANVTGLATGVVLDGDTLRVNPNAYNSLAVGEHATITVNYNVVDGNGGSVPQTATITINGANDLPIPASISATLHDRTTITGAKIADPDIHDQPHVISASYGGKASPISANDFTLIYGKYGELFLYANGSYSYLADPALHSPPNSGAHDIFQYTVDDGHGGGATSTLTLTVTPAQLSTVTPIQIGYPILQTDGSPFETITQGNQSDPGDKLNDHGTKEKNMPLQWAYDFQPPGSTDSTSTVHIHSVSTGIVVFVQDSLTGDFSGYGNVITVESIDAAGKPYYVSYAHLKPQSTTLEVDQIISAGDLVADLGATGTFDGTSSHAHLHIQFGTDAYSPNLVTFGYSSIFSDHSMHGLVADGEFDSNSPAFFDELTMHYDRAPNLSDRIYNGIQGKDIFFANGLGDTIYGAGGGDTLTAGGGKDTFVYKDPAESCPGAGHFDTILGFTHGSDKFDFSTVSGLGNNQAHVQNLSSAPPTVAAHTIDIVATGSDTVIYANASTAIESTGNADLEIHVMGVTTLTALDFLLH